MADGNNRVPRDYALLRESDITSSIVSPAIEANNFELNLALKQDQFGEYP